MNEQRPRISPPCQCDGCSILFMIRASLWANTSRINAGAIAILNPKILPLSGYGVRWQRYNSHRLRRLRVQQVMAHIVGPRVCDINVISPGIVACACTHQSSHSTKVINSIISLFRGGGQFILSPKHVYINHRIRQNDTFYWASKSDFPISEFCLKNRMAQSSLFGKGGELYWTR